MWRVCCSLKKTVSVGECLQMHWWILTPWQPMKTGIVCVGLCHGNQLGERRWGLRLMLEQQLEHQSACCLSEPHLLSSASGPAGRGILITGCCWQIKHRDVWGAPWSTGRRSHTSPHSNQVVPGDRRAGRLYQPSEGSHRNAWCSWHPREAAGSRKQGSPHCSQEIYLCEGDKAHALPEGYY